VHYDGGADGEGDEEIAGIENKLIELSTPGD
jgi:hypothetical protein